MDVKLNANSGIRPAYYGKQPCARKAKASSVSAGRKKDSVEISPEGRELHSRARLLKEMEERYGVRGAGLAMDRSGGETACFASFLDEFDRLLASGDAAHLAVMDMQANQNVRNQLERSVQTLLTQAGVQVPEDVSFRLTVAPSDFYIKADGLDDPELAKRIEEAVNKGDNGKKLYNHILYCNPARFGYEEPARYTGGQALGLRYQGGRLADLDTKFGFGPGQTGWQDRLRERSEEVGLRYMERAEKTALGLEMGRNDR